MKFIVYLVDLFHFTLLRSVGKGAFGKVRVVEHKGTKQLFALKYIDKEKCIRMRAVENVISERRLLEHINYNFIVNLRYAFQDEENLFMVIDLMLGGDLRFHLDRLGALPEEYVRFYCAETALALHYLHKKNIVHRYNPNSKRLCRICCMLILFSFSLSFKLYNVGMSNQTTSCSTNMAMHT